MGASNLKGTVNLENGNVLVPVRGGFGFYNNGVAHLEIVNQTQQFLQQLFLFFQIGEAWNVQT